MLEYECRDTWNSLIGSPAHCILCINRQSPRLNARDLGGRKWCTFPIGGRNVSQLKYVAVGKICEDVVCGAVADEGVKGEQRFEDNLL